MVKISLNGFASEDEEKRAETQIRAALAMPNGKLEFQSGFLAADEVGLVAIIDGSDEELGDGKKKCALVDTVFEQVAIIATKERAAKCKLAKGHTSKSRGPSP